MAKNRVFCGGKVKDLNRRPLLLLLILSLASLSGCGGGSGKHPNIFYWNIYTGITSLDPAFARSQANIWVVQQLFNGLVELDEKLKVQPALAKSWEVSADGKEYLFHLRRGILFHGHEAFPNGKPREVKAQDFVYSFQRLLDPATASPGAWIFQGKVESVSPFQALNDSTLLIRLQQPYPPFLSILANAYASVVPKEIVERYGKDFRVHPVGTGPFRLKFFSESEKLILHRNPAYFEQENGRPLPYLDGISISFIESKQNEFFSFLQGRLDLMNGMDASFKDNLLTKAGTLKPKFEGKFQFQKLPFLNTEYIGFHVDSPPAGMSKESYRLLRHAISHAIDRKKMISHLRNGIGTSGCPSMVPPSLSGNGCQAQPVNLAEARRLLSKAGFPQGKSLPPLTLYITSNYLDLAVFLQSELEKVGITIKIENVPSGALAEMKSKGQALFFRGSWIADYPDPENYYSIFLRESVPPNGPNYFRFQEAGYDQAYQALLNENNSEKRAENTRRMESSLDNALPVIVLYYDETVRLLSYRVKGLPQHPTNAIVLKRVKLEE